MEKKVIVIGSGGHAKIIIDILHETGKVDIIGLTSNDLPEGSLFQGYPVLGNDSVLPHHKSGNSVYAVMGVGGYRNNVTRTNLFMKIKNTGFIFLNAIHPRSYISKMSTLGEGVTVFPGAVINAGVTIGNNVIIATNSSIDHDSSIENNVLISAGVTVGASARICEGALMALGSKVISGMTIGANSLIAAGAVVVSNIGDNKTVFGLPAKEIR